MSTHQGMCVIFYLICHRAEVWEDKVNPLNDWWEAYAPSDEEVEAAALGFDFKDPQAWCQVT